MYSKVSNSERYAYYTYNNIQAYASETHSIKLDELTKLNLKFNAIFVPA